MWTRLLLAVRHTVAVDIADLEVRRQISIDTHTIIFFPERVAFDLSLIAYQALICFLIKASVEL